MEAETPRWTSLEGQVQQGPLQGSSPWGQQVPFLLVCLSAVHLLFVKHFTKTPPHIWSHFKFYSDFFQLLHGSVLALGLAHATALRHRHFHHVHHHVGRLRLSGIKWRNFSKYQSSDLDHWSLPMSTLYYSLSHKASYFIRMVCTNVEAHIVWTK